MFERMQSSNNQLDDKVSQSITKRFQYLGKSASKEARKEVFKEARMQQNNVVFICYVCVSEGI